MSAPFLLLTKTWHTALYPAIDPARPNLSAKSKTILVPGWGSGIGAQIAIAYAKAGALGIAIWPDSKDSRGNRRHDQRC